MKRIEEILSELHPDTDFNTEEDLVDDGILDSFDIVTLVTEINEEFDVAIPAEEINSKNFNSAKAMQSLIDHLENE